MRKTTIFPIPVNRELKKLGTEIKEARIRRRITTAMMCERAGITRPTLAKVERGDPMTSMGIYAKVLFVLNLHEKLGEIADIRYDQIGLSIEAAKLPKRVRQMKTTEAK
ncbi:MAG: helix-turn-helix domain-containing protein [Alphaproteobacteria bacterium]|nr:helix-turn-helix domain-containing protein [Alphaproteobacteria bacterium]